MFDNNSSGVSFYKGYTIDIKEEKKIHLSSEVAGIGFVKKGEVYLSAGEIKAKKVQEGNLIFFPPAMLCFVSASCESSLFILEVPEITFLCHRFFPTVISHGTVCQEEFFFSLSVHPYIENVIGIVEEYIQEGFTDPLLIEIKTYELFYFINICYSGDLIQNFLSPILSEKYQFTHFVLSYYSAVKTVEELAGLSSYSLSGFDKVFRKVFGMAPYKWMLKMKIKSIYRDIKETSKPLKLIAKEHNFETPSRLTDFCRRHLGEPPSLMRKKTRSKRITN